MADRDPFQAVRRLAQAMPDVEEGTYWGTPALRIRGRVFACMASHSSAEPETLVVWTDLDQREHLIAEEPAIYYLKEHYVSWPLVLVRLRRINTDALSDLLIGARQIVAAKGPVKKRPSRRPGTRPQKVATKTRSSRKAATKEKRKRRR